jgi:hypothetical protein
MERIAVESDGGVTATVSAESQRRQRSWAGKGRAVEP